MTLALDSTARFVPTAILLGLILGLAPTAGPAAAEAALDSPGSSARGPLHGAMLAELAGLERQLLSLAKAFPEGKHDWRPAEGIDSVAEVLQHLIEANAMLVTALEKGSGKEPPATDGDEPVIVRFERSMARALAAIEAVGEDDWSTVAMAGGQTKAWAAMRVLNHGRQHLGQLIAYARSVGVVPPWSRPAE